MLLATVSYPIATYEGGSKSIPVGCTAVARDYNLNKSGGHFNPAYSGGSVSTLDNYYKPHGSTGYGQRMRGGSTMPPEPDPDYEAVDGTGSGRPGDKPRKVLLIIFIFGSAVATALLICLVVLAPTEKALRNVGLLP